MIDEDVHVKSLIQNMMEKMITDARSSTGKSTILACLGSTYTSHEMVPLDKTTLQDVIKVDKERIRLEAETKRLAAHVDDGTFRSCDI
ncbi:unnamed protein product [Didymodactylos carnosus]|nr:unnamed protein product [Didymodactylos carnosus]CAF3522636.1 unnamed protein product [Didymodactylos carnosus]